MLKLKSLLPQTNLSKREIWLLTILFPIPGWTLFVALFALYKVIKQKMRKNRYVGSQESLEILPTSLSMPANRLRLIENNAIGEPLSSL